jgi:peptidyl-prolyl cis-trans isomerase SurA
MMRYLAALGLAALLLSAPSGLQAQIPGGPQAGDPGTQEMVDRIAAVVGDSIILYSQIAEETARLEAQLQAQGQSLPDDPEERRQLERDILEDLVNQLLLLQAAEQDTLVTVSDARLEDTYRQAWEGQLQRFGGEDQLRQAVTASGLTLNQYRMDLREQIRRELLLQSLIQLERSRSQGIAVEEAEVREIFEQERERLGQRPATITLRHIFFEPQPSDSAKAAARAQAEEILELLRGGEDFSTLARRFSDDPGSAQEGGDLGWYRRGDGLIEEFEDVAFSLRENQTSGIVETAFGAHIIRVDRIRGPERRIHHILVQAEATDEDDGRLRSRAEEVAERIRGGASFQEFADEGTRFGIPDSLTVAETQLDQFPEAYAQALQAASPGEVVGPIPFPLGEAGLQVYVVARIEEVREAGEYRFEDVRAQIRSNLREQRFEERLIERLRNRTYIDIRL